MIFRKKRKRQAAAEDPVADPVPDPVADPVADPVPAAACSDVADVIVPPSLSASSERRQELSLENIELDMLRRKVKTLEEKVKALETAKFCYANVTATAGLLLHYTGLPDSTSFDALHHLCTKYLTSYYGDWAVKSVITEDQLLLTLMKLRNNFSLLDLGVRFGVSNATVLNITQTWIHLLHEVLYEGILVAGGIPSVAKNQSSLPSSFATFKNCRIVLDCTEVQVAIPSQMDQQSATYSHYKHRNTFKALVGVAPNGVVVFVSKLYPGSSSDKVVVEHSRVLDQTVPGDLVIADKGFLIQDLMPSGVTLNLPPFLDTAQFTVSQARATVSIARARIHVERAIQRIKLYGILNFIPYQYRSLASTIFQVCACLTNLQTPLLKESEEAFLARSSSASKPTSLPSPTLPLSPHLAEPEPTTFTSSAESYLSATAPGSPSSAASHACQICGLKDARILRTCRNCSKKYHHMCQLNDEDGKLCNACFGSP